MNHIQALAENVIYAQPRSPTADIRDFLDKRHGVGGWTYRTGVGLGTDIQPAVNDALDALRARYGRGELLLPPGGQYRLATPFDPVKCSGHLIRGYGSQHNILVPDFSSGVLFPTSGSGGYTGGGFARLGALLEDGRPSTTVEILRLSADAIYAADQTMFEDLYVSTIGTSYWYNGVVAAGTARTSPQGIRIVLMRNIQVFKCSNAGAQFYNCVGWSADNLGIYAGVGNGNDMFIGGGGAANTNTTQFGVRDLIVSGALNLSNATKVGVWGSAASVVAAATFDYHTGTVFSSTVLSGALGPKGNLQVIT